MNFNPNINEKIFYQTPDQLKNKIVNYLEQQGYNKNDILNQKLFRHFKAFYNYLLKTRRLT